MKTTKRFDSSVTKLYNAFHEGRLRAANCSYCAVGNIVGHGNWHGGFKNDFKSYIGFDKENKSGYSSKELSKVEFEFIKHIIEQDKNGMYLFIDLEETKENQFKGLCAVVEYLAELDNIPNPMDYTKLFETNEKNEPKYELTH